jgi:hypothetical protein
MISFFEASIVNEPTGGQGLLVTATFDDASAPPIYDDDPTSPVGCEVRLYGGWPPSHANAGLLTFHAEDDTPIMPPCTLVPGEGYQCIANAGSLGPPDAISSDGGGLATLTHFGAFTSDDIGRYLEIRGAGLDNDGTFPVVAVSAAAGRITYVNQTALSLPVPMGSTFEVRAGAGPIPGTIEPGYLEDDDGITVVVEGSAAWVPLAAGTSVGARFALSSSSAVAMQTIDVTVSAPLVLSCAVGDCGDTPSHSLVLLETSDGPVAGLPPHVMPVPVTRRVVAWCMTPAATVTIPAAVMDLVRGAGATRIQTTFARARVTSVTDASGRQTTRIAVGHAMLGFTTP